MIAGIGIDVVEVPRLQRFVDRFGEPFARRMLDEVELESYRESPHLASFLARRLAAKEAFAKAMGTGFAEGLSRRDVGVRHGAGGAPFLEIRGEARRLLEARAIRRAYLSISDEKTFAAAVVILEA